MHHQEEETTQKNYLTSNSANSLVMVRPANFGQNPQTIGDNSFQLEIKEVLSKQEIQQRALKEFNNYVQTLKENGVKVIVIEDTAQPIKPDAIFPNNWFTTDPKRIIKYPMMSANRRLQRELPVFQTLEAQGYILPQIFDFTSRELQKQIVEGTGSMIFDHQNKIAYACRSERTTASLFEQICTKYYDYSPIVFTAKGSDGKLIYHTNVMMCVGSNFVIVCLESIENEEEKEKVKKSILSSKRMNGKYKQLVELSMKQVENYCGNVLQVKNQEGKLLLVMGKSAYSSFRKDQIEQLEGLVDKIVVVELPTIQAYGGGGARCMLAEIFLNKK